MKHYNIPFLAAFLPALAEHWQRPEQSWFHHRLPVLAAVWPEPTSWQPDAEPLTHSKLWPHHL